MSVHKAIINVLKEVGAISKSQKNAAQGYKFRGIDDFMNELHVLFAKHDLFVVPEVLDVRREERAGKSGGLLIWTISTIRFTFTSSDGSVIHCTTVGEAMDSGDKGANKAMSAALKYALMQVFLVPTEDLVDADKESPEPAPKPAPARKDDMGMKGYFDLVKVFTEVFDGKDEAESCKILGAIEGIYNESLHQTAKQLLVDMLKTRGVLFNKKGSEVSCTGLTVQAYTDVTKQFGVARESMEAKVA